MKNPKILLFPLVRDLKPSKKCTNSKIRISIIIPLLTTVQCTYKAFQMGFEFRTQVHTHMRMGHMRPKAVRAIGKGLVKCAFHFESDFRAWMDEIVGVFTPFAA